VRFIDDPLYHDENAEHALEEMSRQRPIDESAKPEELRIPRDLPPYLQDLYRTPLLTAARERALFLKFNFHKYQFVQARRRFEPQFATSRQLAELEAHLKRAVAVKNDIVRANLRLVVSVARKHLRGALNLMELVSDGNVTLMRAVESFDVHKGNRFSTYTTFALMKGFARSVPLMLAQSRRMMSNDEVLGDVADGRVQSDTERLMNRDELRQLLSHLDDRERSVLAAHYGLDEKSQTAARSTSTTTYEQLGRRLGLSKQRVRLIAQIALSKRRAAAR
jgi:RNA polymerase sigma factor (sigma-70 family)